MNNGINGSSEANDFGNEIWKLRKWKLQKWTNKENFLGVSGVIWLGGCKRAFSIEAGDIPRCRFHGTRRFSKSPTFEPFKPNFYILLIYASSIYSMVWPL